jgi:hypothetical protein
VKVALPLVEELGLDRKIPDNFCFFFLIGQRVVMVKLNSIPVYCTVGC